MVVAGGWRCVVNINVAPPDSLVQLVQWWGVNEHVGVREALSLCPKLQ